MGADEGAPCAADALGPGEGTSREAAEDVDEDVGGKADAVAPVVASVHRDVATTTDAPDRSTLVHVREMDRSI
jgi:hypothetical protein